MWAGFKRALAFVLGFAMPGSAVIVALFGFGFLAGEPAFGAAAAVLVLSLLAALPLGFALGATEAEIEALGPEAASPAEHRLARSLRRFSPMAQALWPPVLRLQRAWREHAARGEARLAAAEAVITAMPNPLILIDRERRIVRANPPAAEFVGSVAEPRDLAAALRNPALLAAADAVLRGTAAQNVEFALSGSVIRQLEARFARIPRSGGPGLDGAAAILTLHDVTGLRRAEQMRADFIANAGHELKTPLATLIGFIETLLGPARDDAEARERFLAIMREEAHRMARLVEDLRSLSRIEQSEHVTPTGTVALAPLIEHVAAALELRAAERGMRIRLDLAADLPEVQGERDELAQLFQNLLDNAIKYGRPQTEIAVTGGLSAEVAPAQAWVAVADRGEGIPHDHLPRLTERFYRVDTGRSREMGGTGLGLAIVKHVLNRHRGHLDIASTLGVGSIFTVWLPAATSPRSPSTLSSAEAVQAVIER
jgi:two-component system phosphate regulon sensor histidine kinase PhoR